MRSRTVTLDHVHPPPFCFAVAPSGCAGKSTSKQPPTPGRAEMVSRLREGYGLARPRPRRGTAISIAAPSTQSALWRTRYLSSTFERGRVRDGGKTPVHALPLLLGALAQGQAALGLEHRRQVTGKMSPEQAMVLQQHRLRRRESKARGP